MRQLLHPKFLLLICSILFHSMLSIAQEQQNVPFAPPFKQVWQYQVENLEVTGNQVSVFSTPVFDARRIYFASTNGVLYCLFKGTWQTSWTFHTSAPISLELALSGSTICFTDGNSVYALDARTGVPLWIHSAPSAVTAGLKVNRKPVTAGLEAFEDAVYYADILGSVRCLSLKTGELLWEYKPTIEDGETDSASVHSGLHVDDQYLIFGDDRNQLAALRISNGEKAWSFKAEGEIQSGILRHGNRIFFGSNDNHVYCVEAGTGKLNWKQRTAGDVRGVPVCDNEFVYISSRDRSLRVINMFNGYPARVGPIPLTVNFDFSPLIVDKMLYIPQGAVISPRITEGTFRAVSPYSNTAGDITTSLVLDEEEKFLYFGTRLGKFVVVAPQALELNEFLISPDIAADVELPDIDPTAGDDSNRRERRREDRKKDPEPVDESKEDEATDQEKTTPAKEEKTPESQPEPVKQEEVQKETPDVPETPPEKAKQTPEVEIIPEKPSAESTGTLAEMLLEAREILKAGDVQAAATKFTDALRPDREKWYTINLGLYCQQDTMSALIETLKDQEIIVFQRQLEDKTCYFICFGLYESRHDAEVAIEDLEMNDRFEAEVNALRIDSFIPEN